MNINDLKEKKIEDLEIKSSLKKNLIENNFLTINDLINKWSKYYYGAEKDLNIPNDELLEIKNFYSLFKHKKNINLDDLITFKDENKEKLIVISKKNPFNENKHQLEEIEDILKKHPKYRQMLNNLLGISGRDNSIFVVKSKTKDLHWFLNKEDFKKIFSEQELNLKISSENDRKFIEKLEFIESYEEFKNFVIENNNFSYRIGKAKWSVIEEKYDNFKNFKNEGINSYHDDNQTKKESLKKEYEDEKNEIIKKFKEKLSKKNNEWKGYKKKCDDIQRETNIWPLYIGTFYIKIKTNRTAIYTPLFLKKVEIEIKINNDVVIKSIGSPIEINEKLLFMLQDNNDFNFPKIENSLSFSSVIKKATQYLEKFVLNKDIDFEQKFKFLKKDEVVEKDLEFAPGATLIIASPSGGKLRDKLIEIIKNKEIDDVLQIDRTRREYSSVKDFINHENNKLYRINPTDFSQEKAIANSLKEHTIIWGPPGTGKSATIINILANLLIQDKSVVMTSQKKAALDIIKTNIDKLSKFIFFILNDGNAKGKKERKKSFYKNLDDLISSYKNYSKYGIKINNQFFKSYFEKEHIDYMEQKETLKDENISAIISLKSNIKEIKKMMIDNINLQNKINSSNISNVYNNFKKIENFDNFISFDEKEENEKEYLKNLKIEAEINKKTIDYLEESLIEIFSKRIEEIKKKDKKKINKFIKDISNKRKIPYKFIDEYKEIIRNVFKIFVSTPEELSNFIDMNQKYDYAIFDEASQLNLEKAYPFLSIAKINIIAGDDKQMQPSNIFSIRDNKNIDEEYEEDEEPIKSLLDEAIKLNLREYMLEKNYRSKYASLMSFSSKWFYDSKLKVLNNKFLIPSPIEVFNVNGKWEKIGESNKKINMAEAKAIVKKTKEIINEYDDKKIILLTFNIHQKQLISDLIINDENTTIKDLYYKNKISLRNLENIQGDEADIVLISIAYDKNARISSGYVGKKNGKNALNVAISRAKEKCIIFKSIDAKDVSTISKNESMKIFKEWLNFLELSEKEKKEYSISENKNDEKLFDSGFEKNVYEYLFEKMKTDVEVKFEKQYSVGSYRIDIAILNKNTNDFLIGLEIDGYKYHSGYEKISQDIERQKFLELKGYDIYRITEIIWKINKDKIIKDINILIRKNNIENEKNHLEKIENID